MVLLKERVRNEELFLEKVGNYFLTHSRNFSPKGIFSTGGLDETSFPYVYPRLIRNTRSLLIEQGSCIDKDIINLKLSEQMLEKIVFDCMPSYLDLHLNTSRRVKYSNEIKISDKFRELPQTSLKKITNFLRTTSFSCLGLDFEGQKITEDTISKGLIKLIEEDTEMSFYLKGVNTEQAIRETVVLNYILGTKFVKGNTSMLYMVNPLGYVNVDDETNFILTFDLAQNERYIQKEKREIFENLGFSLEDIISQKAYVMAAFHNEFAKNRISNIIPKNLESIFQRTHILDFEEITNILRDINEFQQLGDIKNIYNEIKQRHLELPHNTLIHSDPVCENWHVGKNGVYLMDYGHSSYGYREIDLARATFEMSSPDNIRFIKEYGSFYIEIGKYLGLQNENKFDFASSIKIANEAAFTHSLKKARAKLEMNLEDEAKKYLQISRNYMAQLLI